MEGLMEEGLSMWHCWRGVWVCLCVTRNSWSCAQHTPRRRGDLFCEGVSWWSIARVVFIQGARWLVSPDCASSRELSVGFVTWTGLICQGAGRGLLGSCVRRGWGLPCGEAHHRPWEPWPSRESEREVRDELLCADHRPHLVILIYLNWQSSSFPTTGIGKQPPFFFF